MNSTSYFQKFKCCNFCFARVNAHIQYTLKCHEKASWRPGLPVLGWWAL